MKTAPLKGISLGDCEKLLASTSELYSVGEIMNLPQQVLHSIRSLIPHEFAGCHLIEPSRHHIAAFYQPEQPMVPSQHKDFWRLSKTHPLHPVLFTNPSRAWKLSDVMTRQAFHATEYYNVLYRPLQVDCELVAALPDPNAPSAFLLISLHRRREDFSERDRTLLNLLLPHVANARRRMRASPSHSLHSGGGPESEVEFFAWVRAHTSWGLTRRESEVLFWLYQGKTNSEIGRILGIAERTAETHSLRLYPKMGVENRYTAISTLNRLSLQPVTAV